MKNYSITLTLLLMATGTLHTNMPIEKAYRLYYQGRLSWDTPPPETMWWCQTQPPHRGTLHRTKKPARYKAIFVSPGYLTLTHKSGTVEYRPTREYHKQKVEFDGTLDDSEEGGWRGMVTYRHTQKKRDMIFGKFPNYGNKDWINKLYLAFQKRYGSRKPWKT